MSDVSSLTQDPFFSEYSPHGRDFGHPVMNLLMRSTFGYNYAPKPQDGQGMYDAYMQRERSREFYDIQKDSFANNMLFKAGGVDSDNALLQFGASALSSPDGLAARMLSPLIGGNPMAAQMQLYAGLNGANVMGAFGRVEGVSKKETDQAMRALEKSFYKIDPMEKVTQEMDEGFREELMNNPEYAKQLGIGVPIKADGSVDTEAEGKLKQKGQDRSKKADDLAKLEDEFKLNEGRKTASYYDPNISQNAVKNITQNFKDLGVSPEKLSSLVGDNGELNPEALSSAYKDARKDVRTDEDYQKELVSAMAGKMGLPEDPSSRSYTLRGGVPSEIDGKEVPAHLLTKDQRNNIDAARDLEAKMRGKPSPPRIDPTVAPAPDDTYAGIKPADQGDKVHKYMEALGGIRDLNSRYEANEKKKSYSDPEIEGMRKDLVSQLSSSPAVNKEDLLGDNLNEDVVTKFKDSTKEAVAEINRLGVNIDKNEIKKGTKEYDSELAKALGDRLKKTLKESFNATDEELSKASTSPTQIDKNFVNSKVDSRQESTAKVARLFDKYQNAQKVKTEEAQASPETYDPKVTKKNVKVIEKELKALGLTSEEIASAKDKDGNISAQVVEKLLSTRKADTPELKEGKKEIAEALSEIKRNETSKTYDPVKAKKLDDEIRIKLKKDFNVTDEQLKKVTTPQGFVDPAFVQEVYDKEKKVAVTEKAGVDPKKLQEIKLSENAEKMESNHIDRLVQVRHIEDLQRQKTEASGSKSKRAKEKETAAAQKIEEALIELGVSKEDIDKNSHTEGGILGFGGKKVIDEEFLTQKKAELGQQNKAERDAQRYTNYKKAGGRYAGINFENTRGFNIEDFTSAFTAAADLRLLGNDKGTPAAKMGEFGENAGGALSAARGVFGDKLSGGQLVGKISDLLGSKAANLGSQEGSAEVEKMLRDVKATAKTAGVSIDVLLGVIDSAKDLAKNNPRLKYMSGAAITDMSLKSLNTVAGMAGVMSGKEYRQAGGTQQMLAENIGEQQQLLSSEAGQSIAALKQMYSSDPKKKAALERVLEKYKDSGITGGKDLGNIIKDMVNQPEMAGESLTSIYQGMNSAGIRKMAMQDTDIVNSTQDLVNKSGVSTFFARLKGVRMDDGKKATRENVVAGFKEARQKNPELTLDQYMSGIVRKDQASANFYSEFKSTISTAIRKDLDPEYFKKVEARAQKMSKLDADLDKKFASRNAPVITQIISTLSKGGALDEKKTKELLGVFADTKLYKPEETKKLSEGFSEALYGASTQDSGVVAKGLSSALGIDVSKAELENINTSGRSEGGFEDATNHLRTLRDKKKKGKLNKTEQKRLEALESLDNIGILNNEQAYNTFRKGEGVAGVTAGAIEAEKNKKNKELLESQKTEIAKNLGDDLKDQAKASSTSTGEKAIIDQVIQSYTDKDGKLNTAQLMKDAEEGTGVFDKTSKEGSKFNFTDGPGAEVKSKITEANEAVKEAEKKAASSQGGEDTKKTGGLEDVSGQIKALVESLDNSKLTQNIGILAGKLGPT
jgi:hypothetical protein